MFVCLIQSTDRNNPSELDIYRRAVMTTENLLTETPGSELHATWETLATAGIGRADLKKIRSNPDLAQKIAKLLAVRERRTKYRYPSEFKPIGITDQIKTLQKVPAFAELDASWALNDGQAWYDDLEHPEWVEKPLVYIWHEAVGGYHTALDLVFSAIAKERKFCNHRKGQLTPERLRQAEVTREAEAMLKADQPGGFLIVPSQVGDRWGGYSVKEARESFDENEFGHGSLATGCLALTHPERLVRLEELDMDCPGDEFDHPDAGDRFDHAPYFEFYDGKVTFGTLHVGASHDSYGSVSGSAQQ